METTRKISSLVHFCFVSIESKRNGNSPRSLTNSRREIVSIESKRNGNAKTQEAQARLLPVSIESKRNGNLETSGREIVKQNVFQSNLRGMETPECRT